MPPSKQITMGLNKRECFLRIKDLIINKIIIGLNKRECFLKIKD